MMKNLSYKQKLYWLAGFALIMFFLCYQFSIAKAIHEHSAYSQRRAASLQDVNSASLGMLESKSRMLDGLLDQFVLDTLDDNKNLLGVTSDFCNQSGIKLKEYKPLGIHKTDSLALLTRSVTVEGSFKKCLQFVYDLETKFKAGRVSSVLFKSAVEPATSKTFLTCTVFIQNLISPSHDEK